MAVWREKYSPRDASLTVDEWYQNVRIVTVYDTDQVPGLPWEGTDHVVKPLRSLPPRGEETPASVDCLHDIS